MHSQWQNDRVENIDFHERDLPMRGVHVRISVPEFRVGGSELLPINLNACAATRYFTSPSERGRHNLYKICNGMHGMHEYYEYIAKFLYHFNL